MANATEETQREALALLTTIDATATSSSGSAATRTRQDTGNASLASIDGKLPALVSGLFEVATRARAPQTGAVKTAVSLPAVGAYEADPTTSDDVAIPDGTSKAVLVISYTRGGASGGATHKVYLTYGSVVAQLPDPAGSYAGIAGRVSVSASAISYTIDVACQGASAIGMASAETGNTGSPGTYTVTAYFT